MLRNTIKMALVTMAAGVLLAGCSGGARGPQIFAGFNGDPHCAPGPKPCPREYPEFPLPPGGPYLQTPGHVAPGPQGAAPAQRLNLNAGQEKLTVAK